MSRIEEFFEKSVDSGIIPQIPMNYDAVSYKIYTGYLENKIDELTAENAELRERLDKAAGLPCEMPNTIYTVIKNCASCKHYNVSWAECGAPATANFDCESTHRTCFNQDIIDDECKKHLYIVELRFELGFLDDKTGDLKPQYFIDRESAEARRKELQGGEQK